MATKKENAAELVVWTDVEAEHEFDFNRWYDREHMAERVGISGFIWGRRLRLESGAGPRYLALYRAKDIGVFTSDAYSQAFQHQSDWSNRNFPRMRNPRRRVMTVPLEVGVGTGSAWGCVNLRQPTVDVAKMAGILAEICRGRRGIFGLRHGAGCDAVDAVAHGGSEQSAHGSPRDDFRGESDGPGSGSDTLLRVGGNFRRAGCQLCAVLGPARRGYVNDGKRALGSFKKERRQCLKSYWLPQL